LPTRHHFGFGGAVLISPKTGRKIIANVSVNGIRLHYDIEGEGPPLLLITGLGGHSGVWATVKPLLVTRFKLITFDNRGTGRSDVPPGPYSIDQMADDVAGLLRHLNLGPIDVVGWSLGGSVLQSLLIRHGALLKRAVILSGFPSYTGIQDHWLDCMLALSTSGLPALTRAINSMAWGFTARFLYDHNALEAGARMVAEMDQWPTTPAGLAAQAQGLRIYDSRPDLPKVKTPTLVLVGAEDVLTPPSQSVEMAELIPTAHLQILPRGGHGMILEYTQDTVGAITKFLASPGSV
jgi:3-oxoadipate enol-lactonase